MGRLGIFLLFLVSMALQACDSGDVHQPSIYFPTDIGRYMIYAVDEIQYQGSEDPVVLQYQMKTRIVEALAGDAGTISLVVYRYKRATASDSWDYLDTWSFDTNRLRTIVYEENVPFVKLSYPASLNRTWDGNAFNAQEEDMYELVGKGAYSVPAGSFNDCVRVIQEDNQDFIVFQDYREEVYGASVGLLYKETINISYCTLNCGAQQIDTGFEFRQTLIEYGQE